MAGQDVKGPPLGAFPMSVISLLHTYHGVIEKGAICSQRAPLGDCLNLKMTFTPTLAHLVLQNEFFFVLYILFSFVLKKHNSQGCD